MNERVLIIEDDKDLKALLEEVFRDEGYEVHSAFEIDRARRLLKTNSYSIVLLDMRFTGNGFNILEHISNDNTRIFIISGDPFQGLSSEKKKLLEKAKHIFVKPFEIDEVLEEVKKYNNAPDHVKR